MSQQSDGFSRVGQDIHRLFSDKADKHEIHSANSRIDRLESDKRQLEIEVNGLRGQIENMQNQIQGLMQREEENI